MSRPIGSIVLTPGISKNISLANIPNVQGIKFTNGTPFDMTISGFGVIGSSIIPAGTEYMLHADIYNSGFINILAVNNSGVTGNGVVNLVIFDTGESLPKGTWPISIPTQTVAATVSTVQTLSNEGAAAGTLVIDMGPLANLNIVQLWNDHFSWSVVQSGVAHTVLQGQTSGNPLLIGKSGDISEVLGNLTVDGTSIHTGASTFSSTVSTGSLTMTNGASMTGGDLALNTHNITSANNLLATSLQSNTLNDSGGSGVLSVTAGTTTRVQSPNTVTLQIGGASVFGVVANQAVLSSGCTLKLANGNTIQGISSFTGSATGTFSHTYGSAPFFVLPVCDVLGSETVGYDTVTATQVHITIGAALGFKVMCFG